jgi:hypothetical protein
VNAFQNGGKEFRESQMVTKKSLKSSHAKVHPTMNFFFTPSQKCRNRIPYYKKLFLHAETIAKKKVSKKFSHSILGKVTKEGQAASPTRFCERFSGIGFLN